MVKLFSTAGMMHKDISLGIALGEKFDVPLPTTEYVAGKYEEAMAKYGADSGSSIPCRMVEDAAHCRLIDGAGSADEWPGNSVAHDSHNRAFKNWSYTTELCGGSYTVMHTGYENP